MTIDTRFSAGNRFWSESTTNLAAAASFTGASRDVGVAPGAEHLASKFAAFALSAEAGTLRTEASNDGVTWFRTSADTAVAANTPVTVTVPVIARYNRAVYVNGAAIQTSFFLNSGYLEA